MYERMNIEDWKAKKKNDRDAVLADQKQALQEVLQDGTHLTAYLLGRGRLGSGITSGNAALVLKACPQATAVMSFDGWNQFGRRVSKGAVGISQLVRSSGYFTVGKVYDRSATYGNKPCPTVELQGDQLGKAVAVLTALSPVEVQFDDKQPTGFLADENLILYLQWRGQRYGCRYGRHFAGYGRVQSAIENVGFLASIPLWLVTILGSLFITVLSFVMILTVYGRFFRLYMYTALAPLPLASFAGESTQSVGISFIKSYVGVCLEGAVIVLACVIYAAFVSTPTVSGGEATTMVWSYLTEIIFNMLVLVGLIKGSDRIIHEMMGL